MPIPAIIAPFADSSSSSSVDGTPNGLTYCQDTEDGAIASVPQGNAPPIVFSNNVVMFGVGARKNVTGVGAPWLRAWTSIDGGSTWVVSNGINDTVVGGGNSGIKGGIGIGFSIQGSKAACFYQDPGSGNLAAVVFDTVAFTWAAPNVSSITVDSNY